MRTASSSPSSPGSAEAPIRAALLDTPDTGLNQAFTWAAARNPAAVRAESGVPDDWGGSELALLLEQGRAFRRVGPAAVPDPAELVCEVVGGLFGLRADAGGRYAVAPWLPEGWRSLALRRARCHRTVLDIEARPRAEWVTVRLAVTFGPPIAVALSVRNVSAVSRAVVDGVELEGDRAIFTASGEHEAMFFHGGGSS